MSQSFRTRFAKDIVTEFMVPKRPSTRVMIFCFGMPSQPGHKKILEFFAKKGWWAFEPRYRGSWESDGKFLAMAPTRDLLDVLDGIPRGFSDFWTGQKFRVKPSKIVVVGASFGGPAALLASRDPRIHKVIGVSAVTDWTKDSKEEPLPWLETFLHQAYGQAFRFRHSDWKKLSNGKFYNPAGNLDRIDGKKIFLIHARDDKIVPCRSVQTFAERVNCQLSLVKTGGHFASSILTTPRFYKKIQKFLKSR